MGWSSMKCNSWCRRHCWVGRKAWGGGELSSSQYRNTQPVRGNCINVSMTDGATTSCSREGRSRSHGEVSGRQEGEKPGEEGIFCQTKLPSAGGIFMPLMSLHPQPLNQKTPTLKPLLFFMHLSNAKRKVRQESDLSEVCIFINISL